MRPEVRLKYDLKLHNNLNINIMEKILSYLLRKAWQIFFPLFLCFLGIFVGFLPIFITVFTGHGWVAFWLFASLPLMITIIILTIQLTDWDDVWDFEDLDDIRNDSTGIL